MKNRPVLDILGGYDGLKDDLVSALCGNTAKRETQVFGKDKKPLDATLWLGPLMDEGEVLGGYIMLADSSGRRQRECVLEERYLRLNSLVGRARLGIVVIDQNHKVIETNLRFAEMLGYAMEEMLELHTWDWEVNMTREQIEVGFSDLSKIDISFQTKHRRKNGSVYDVNVSATGTCIQGREGPYNAVICICEDISAQKEIERKLVQSERKYRNFVESAADIMYIVDAQGFITYVSPNCKKMWGYEQEEIAGMHFTELLDIANTGECMDRVKEIINSGCTPYAEQVIHHKDGTSHWYGINCSLSADEEGAPILICSARNIDEKKEYEERLKYFSIHDQLTGIYNRTFFNEELERQYEKKMYPISIVSCDIDGLKRVNDTLGHDAGDEMIIKSANLLSSFLRKGDCLARIGGDEFAMILPLTGEDEAARIINKIKRNFRRHGDRGRVQGISIGFTTMHDGQKTVTQALKEADTNMYIDKRRQKRKTGTDAK